MEAADDIAYTLADLEDGVEIGILTIDKYIELVNGIAQQSQQRINEEKQEDQKFGLLRAKAVGELIKIASKNFLEEEDFSERSFTKSLISESKENSSEKDAVQAFEEIKTYNKKNLYFHPRKVEYEIGARDMLSKALDVFVDACAEFAVKEDNSTADVKRIISLMGDYRPRSGMVRAHVIRCAIDFVSGMTDDYASFLARRLRGLK